MEEGDEYHKSHCPVDQGAEEEGDSKGHLATRSSVTSNNKSKQRLLEHGYYRLLDSFTHLNTWSTLLMSSPPVLGLASLYMSVVVSTEINDMTTLSK